MSRWIYVINFSNLKSILVVNQALSAIRVSKVGGKVSSTLFSFYYLLPVSFICFVSVRLFALNRYFLFEWLLQSTEGVHRKPEKLVAHQLSRPNMYGESCQTGSVHLNYTTKSAIIFTIAASLSRDTVMPHKSGVKYINNCFLGAMK